MSSEGILAWFSDKRREKVLQSLEAHVREVMNCVKALQELIISWRTGTIDLTARYNAVKAFEKAADNLRNSTARLLAGGSAGDAVERTFLLRLMGRVDRIADWSLEAARVITILSSYEVPSQVRDVYVAMSSKLGAIVEATYGAVKYLKEEPLAALNAADTVEKLEEDIDSVYAECRTLLIDAASNLSAPIVVMLFSALDALEHVADACEDACDIVREVVVRLTW
ncbi:MAG: DUF47 family protein [Thermofilaceae archaeon]